MTAKVVVKEYERKETKQKFKSLKLVHDDDHGRLIDCILCKGVTDSQKKEIESHNKVEIDGEIVIDTEHYEFPKAFVKNVTKIVKLA